MKIGEQKKLLQVAIKAAKAAGQIQRKGLGKAHQIRFKGAINLVTEVDKACEDKVLKIIRQHYPNHDFLTEESGSLQKDLKQKSQYKWIIDPLDGTTNYAHAYPVFCVSIGLEYQGKVILGVVYEPNMDQLFVGIRGKGAFRNGQRIHVSKIKELGRSLLATGFAYNIRTETENNIEHFKNFLMKTQAVRRDGAAAVDICYVAWGRFDGFWEKDLWPWDTSAAVLILEEAGGKVSMYNGEKFDLYGRQIIASNGKLHTTMVEVLTGNKR